MLLSNAPGKILLPFATSGAKNTIPVASQIGVTGGAASYTDGFPPLTRTPIASGGIPPFGQDMNGILYSTSALDWWYSAGAGFVWDSAFATNSNVGGYPQGARVLRSDGKGYWLNTADNNTTSPEASATAAPAAGWVPDATNGVASVAMTNANVTLTPLQYGCPIISISGVLTANVQLIFPPIAGEWTVINATTGAFTITGKTAGGAGTTLSGVASIAGDGTNIYAVSGGGGSISTGVSFKNRIINGDMRVDQRHLGAAQTIVAGAGAVYTVDRFYASCTGANVTGQQVAGTTSDQYAYQFTGATGVTGITFGERIESTNIYDLAGSTVTASIEITDSTLTTVNWAAYYPGAKDNWGSRTLISSGSFTVTGTKAIYSTQIALPTQCQNGLNVEYTVGAQTSGTLTYGDMQVEAGAVATAFERLPIDIVLLRCQRYLPAFNLPTGASGFPPIGGFGVGGASGTDLTVNFSVPTRVPPTGLIISNITHFGYDYGVGTTAFGGGTMTFSNASTIGAAVIISGALTAGTAVILLFNAAGGNGQLLFTGCEL